MHVCVCVQVDELGGEDGGAVGCVQHIAAVVDSMAWMRRARQDPLQRKAVSVCVRAFIWSERERVWI